MMATSLSCTASYILTKDRRSSPFFSILVHGVSLSCTCENSPGGNVNESLNFVGPNIGFECAKRGYDVWLMDLRATLPYTYNHTTLDPDRDLEFWDFSFDDIAFFDLPKAIDYIRFNTKRRKIAMVGASLGNIEYFYLASKVPRFNQVVQPVVTMFPAISMYGTEWAKRREGLARLIFIPSFLFVSVRCFHFATFDCNHPTRALTHNSRLQIIPCNINRFSNVFPSAAKWLCRSRDICRCIPS